MYKKILVPLDGSEFSECSLEHVKAIATGCQVPEVVLLRVVEPVIPYVEAGSQQMAEQIAKELATAEKRAREEAENYLAKAVAKLKKEGIAARPTVVRGKPAEKILDYTNKNQVDLIIMSTHGRAGISRWAMGSVTDRVLRHSTIPVLIASPPGCRLSG